MGLISKPINNNPHKPLFSSPFPSWGDKPNKPLTNLKNYLSLLLCNRRECSHVSPIWFKLTEGREKESGFMPIYFLIVICGLPSGGLISTDFNVYLPLWTLKIPRIGVISH